MSEDSQEFPMTVVNQFRKILPPTPGSTLTYSPKMGRRRFLTCRKYRERKAEAPPTSASGESTTGPVAAEDPAPTATATTKAPVDEGGDSLKGGQEGVGVGRRTRSKGRAANAASDKTSKTKAPANERGAVLQEQEEMYTEAEPVGRRTRSSGPADGTSLDGNMDSFDPNHEAREEEVRSMLAEERKNLMSRFLDDGLGGLDVKGYDVDEDQLRDFLEGEKWDTWASRTPNSFEKGADRIHYGVPRNGRAGGSLKECKCAPGSPALLLPSPLPTLAAATSCSLLQCSPLPAIPAPMLPSALLQRPRLATICSFTNAVTLTLFI